MPSSRRTLAPWRASTLTAGLLAASALIAHGSPAPAQTADQAALIHHPPEAAQEGRELEIVATVVGDSVEAGEVYYRPPGGEYAVAPLLPEGRYWTAHLPGDRVRPPAVEYFLRVETSRGRQLTFPPQNAAEEPLRVTVEPRQGQLVPLNPYPGSSIDEDKGEILALFEPPLPSTEGVLILLDRRDVTAQAEIEEDFVFVPPPTDLGPGPHEVRVFYLDDEGRTSEGRWSFSVKGAGARPWERVSWNGRCEAGWGAVEVTEAAPSVTTLPYPERSGALLNLSGYGAAAGEQYYLNISRDPIYEGRTRWLARLSGTGHVLEGGDVFPHLSEETVAWLSAQGLSAEVRSAHLATRLLALRTVDQDATEGIFAYDQYLIGGGQELRAGSFRTAVSGAYAFDDEASLDEAFSSSAPPAVRNQAWAWEGNLHRGRLELQSALAWTRHDAAVRQEAWGYRLGLEQLGERSQVSVEFRSHGHGYVALGNPAVNAGEEGVFLDTRLETSARWRTSLRLELYRDYETSQPLEGKRPVVQLWWRLDHEAGAWARGLSGFMILRLYHVPYAGIPYDSDYLSVGTYRQRGSLTGSLSLARSRTRAESVTRLWTINGYLWWRPVPGAFDLKLRGSWDRGKDDLGQTDYRRPGAAIEAGLRRGRTELRASYERMRRIDRVSLLQAYKQEFLSLTLGRTF